MTKFPNVTTRQHFRYEITASKLSIPLEEYLKKGGRGLRFCSKCLVWRKRSSFLEYPHTENFYSGICKKCTPVKSAPFSVEAKLWGPAVRSSLVTGDTPQVYLNKREQGFRWCFAHQGWFDASDMIREGGPRISKCRDCNSKMAARARARRKGSL